MRSFLLVLVTIIVAAFGFVVYWIVQGEGMGPALPRRGACRVSGPATLPSTNPSGLGPGARPYWEKRDPDTGEIVLRMRAAGYEFLKDDRAKLTKPEVEFFQCDGQVVRIMGETGLVTIDQIRRDKSGLTVPEGAPRNGELQKVTILMLPSATATRPTLTATTNNVSFDNETFQIQSAAYEADGQTVPPQLVPVAVRGDDYEFDGRGLRMRYDELHRRLEFLRISYGQRLLIKHPRKFMKGSEATQPTGAMGRSGGGAMGTWGPLPGIVLAAATPAGVRAAVAPAPARGGKAAPAAPAVQKPAEEEPVYRAIFEQNVEVFQGGQRLATAQTLQVDFLGREGDDVSSLGFGGSKPTTKPAATSRPARVTAAKAAPAARKGATAAPKSAWKATTQPAEQPIEVRWTGPLTVAPVPGDRPERIAAGESIIKLSSGPKRPVEIVRSTEQGKHQVRCATLTHWTIDNGALLEAGPGVPVEMTDSSGGSLLTQSLLFSQKDGTALLTGRSRAKIPLQALDQRIAGQKDAKGEIMDVSWTDRCTLHLDGSVMDEMTLKRADLQGGVVASHPRVKVSAQNLQLAFAQPEGKPPSGADAPVGTSPAPAGRSAGEGTGTTSRPSPQLRQMDASGNVKCLAQGTGGPADVRRIACETLTLMTARTPGGELYAQKMVAIGQVHAVDADRDLKAGFMAVFSPPSAKPAGATTRPAAKGEDDLTGQLESLIAHENVRVTTANGEVAEGDDLVIKKEGPETDATLHGRPATVTRGKNVLSGPILDMLQERQQLTVTGEGKLSGMTEKKGDRPARPVRVTWTKSMRADAKSDLIECFGGVTATTLSDDNGSETVARGDRVRILTTQPATTQPSSGFRVPGPGMQAPEPGTQNPEPDSAARSSKPRPTTRPGEFDNLGERQVRSIALEDDAQVESKVYGPGGDLLRLFHTDSSSIFYDRENHKLTIPQAGHMLFMDNRPPAANQSALEAAKDPMGMRGNTAFSWNKSLVYDELNHLATLKGDVRVGRRDAKAPADEETPYLDADTVIAEIEPAQDTAKPAATRPATRPELDEALASKVQFKRIRAEGNVNIRSKQFSADAASLEYDPAKHELVVRGTPNRPVTQYDAKGMPLGSFDELIWNTVEARIVDAKGVRVMSGKPAKSGETTKPATPDK